MNESPLACHMDALSQGQQARHEELLEQAKATAQGIEELADGYRFKFPSSDRTILEMAELITLERLCCPFLDLALEAPRDDGPISLSISGRDGVKEFLAKELGLSL